MKLQLQYFGGRGSGGGKSGGGGAFRDSMQIAQDINNKTFKMTGSGENKLEVEGNHGAKLSALVSARRSGGRVSYHVETTINGKTVSNSQLYDNLSSAKSAARTQLYRRFREK